MIPQKTIEELINKHSNLEKDLSSGNIDKTLFAEKSKEYSDLNEVVDDAKKYISFESDKAELEKILNDQTTDKELLKMAAILKSPDLALIGIKGGDIILKVCDKKNDTSNSFDIVVGQGATADYTFYFKVENMKMLDGDYDVSVSSKSISHFKNKKLPIEYWIALEPDSTITK